MKSFKTYYLTEDKTRFIKKNKNLSRAEKDVVINFFKEYEQAVKQNHRTKIDWNKSGDMTYDDFEQIMDIIKNSPSALKAKARKLRHKGIKGLKEGEDYVTVKTRNKAFLCYIPLHAKANQVIFSSHIGGVGHTGCIGSSQAQTYYKSEAVRKGFVPVVVIGKSKDTVMVKRDNKSWELWDACNNRYSNGSSPFVNKEMIPDFSIKKELMTSKLGDLYDWVRTDIWKKKIGNEYDEEDYDDAVTAYEELIVDIEGYVNEYRAAEEYGREEVDRIINQTIENYREKAEDVMTSFKDDYEFRKTGATKDKRLTSDRIKNRIKNIRMVMAVEPNGTDVNADGEPIWYISGTESKSIHNKKGVIQHGRKSERERDIGYMDDGNSLVAYTRDELESFLDYAEKNYVYDNKENDDFDEDEWVEDEINAREEAKEFTDIADKLDKLLSDGEWYEVYSETRSNDNEWLDDVDWSDYIPDSENDWANEVHSPYLQSDAYESYFDFNEQYGNRVSINGDYSLEDSIREAAYESGYDVNGTAILEDNDYYHPESIVEQI